MARKNIEVIARGVAVHAGHVLVCRNLLRGHIFLPGGHVEFGETAATAIARELREETGLRFSVGRYVGWCEARFRQPCGSGRRRKMHHEINLVYIITPPPACLSACRRRKRRAPPLTGSTDMARQNLAAGSADGGLPRIPSLEDRLEFLWVRLPRSDRGWSTLPILPRAVSPLLRMAVTNKNGY